MTNSNSLTDLLTMDDGVAPPTPSERAASRRLHDGLAARAADADLLDVEFRVLDSPVGELFLAATPVGLVRIDFVDSNGGLDAVVARSVDDLGPRLLEGTTRLAGVLSQLDEYFAGTRRSFDLALDLQLTRAFRREVVAHLPDIGYGRTASYGELAAAVGNPGAARAVGSACATNPLPIVLPCHRVVRADGSIGRYAGGADRKRALLAFEAGQATLV